MPLSWTELPERGVVEVKGPDARHFLHNLLTTDVTRIAPGTAGYGGLLTPQGKILFDFIVHDAGGDCFLLDVARDRAAELTKRLGFYKLRAAVTIADRSDALRVIAAWGNTAIAPAGAVAAIDPRLPELGLRLIVAAADALPDEGRASPAAYAAHRIALGVPDGGTDFAFGDAFPHDADMDQLGGVDFTKGCYTGQEIVARMEHRGTARRRIVRVSADAPLPPAGTPVMAGEVEIGTLGSADGVAGLAMLRIDRAADAMRVGQPITAAGVRLTPALPAWARFTWPDAPAS
ncbi:MAG: folate-binding protein YgfZ [Bauldia sp.]|nr:folate-binding protein YgfZ [Bauldia sp.]